MDGCGAPTGDSEHGALGRDDTGRRSTAGGDERPEAALWKTGGSGGGDARRGDGGVEARGRRRGGEAAWGFEDGWTTVRGWGAPAAVVNKGR
jgi:hypothetical protein